MLDAKMHRPPSEMSQYYNLSERGRGREYSACKHHMFLFIHPWVAFLPNSYCFALGGQISASFSIVLRRPDGDIGPVPPRDGQRPVQRHQPHRRRQDVAHVCPLHTRRNRSFSCRRKCLQMWLAADLKQNHFKLLIPSLVSRLSS